MGDIYRHFYSLFKQEKAKLDQIISGRQDDPPAPVLQTPLVVGAALLGLGVSSLLLAEPQQRQKLEDHPMCGITTGGQVGVGGDILLVLNFITFRKNVTLIVKSLHHHLAHPLGRWLQTWSV